MTVTSVPEIQIAPQNFVCLTKHVGAQHAAPHVRKISTVEGLFYVTAITTIRELFAFDVQLSTVNLFYAST